MKDDDPPKPGVTINGPAQINNSSPGAIQNNYTVRPQGRDLGNPGTRQALLDRIPKGAQFKIIRVNDQETALFSEASKAFLISEGRVLVNDVVDLVGAWRGQTIDRLPDGVYLLRLGSDDGVRGQ